MKNGTIVVNSMSDFGQTGSCFRVLYYGKKQNRIWAAYG